MKYLGFVLGCVATGAMADVPKVAVDIAPVHSIVSAVMGDLGAPDLVIPAGASPHSHAMRPSEARALDQADVVVWMGDALAPWLEGPIESLAGDAVHVSLLNLPQTQLLDVRTGTTFGAHDHDHGHEDHADEAHAHEDDAHDHDKHHDAAHGHDDHGHDDDHADDHADAHKHNDHADHAEAEHADAHKHDDHEDHAEAEHADALDHAAHEGVDPHAWLDPENAIIWAAAIAEVLGQKDPANAATYTANAQAFGADIEALKGEITATLAPVKGRPFVVFHDAYHYFEHRFDIEAAGAVSASDSAAPGAARVSELQAEISALGAVCALKEPQFNAGVLNAIGTTQVGEIDPLGADLTPGAGLYRAVLSNMAASLSACLTPPA